VIFRGTGLGSVFEGALAGETTESRLISAIAGLAAIILDAAGLPLEKALMILTPESTLDKLVALVGDS
jgi:hypothetical protein